MTAGRLEWEELTVAGIVGVLREVSALMAGRPSGHGYDEREPFDTHVNGAAAEVAVAKLTDRYWRPLTKRNLAAIRGDVAAGVQVRSTKRRDGSLIVHPSDPDDARFYLVVTALPDYDVVGWLDGRDAKHDRYLRAPNGRPAAYFVPQADLHAPEDLF